MAWFLSIITRLVALERRATIVERKVETIERDGFGSTLKRNISSDIIFNPVHRSAGG